MRHYGGRDEIRTKAMTLKDYQRTLIESDLVKRIALMSTDKLQAQLDVYTQMIKTAGTNTTEAVYRATVEIMQEQLNLRGV